MVKLKVMLVNPPRVGGYPVVREERFEHRDMGSVYPPLSLLYMAAVLERDERLEIRLVDANGFNLSPNDVRAGIIKFSPDIVIARCGFDTQKEDCAALAAAKDLGALIVLRNKIIAGTPHIRDALLKEGCADVFIDSEPEAVLPGLMDAACAEKQRIAAEPKPYACAFDGSRDRFFGLSFLEGVKGVSYYHNGAVVSTPSAPDTENIDSLPFPAYHLLPSLDVYHTGVMEPPFALVATTRGCPFGCTFCAYGKSKCRERSVESVINELKILKERHGIRSFLFFDDTISIKGGRVEELCRRMKEEGLDKLDWVCCTRANLLDFEMLKAMKGAGMKEIAIGIETGSSEILKNIKKGVSLDDVRRAAKWCKELKIMFYGLAIIGLPGETKETVEETVRFIKEIDPFYTQLCFAVPFPNTDMYAYYDEKGLLLTRDWSKYSPLSDEPVIRTEALSASELKKLRRSAYMSLLLRPAYLLKKVRIFDWRWNIKGIKKVLGRIWAVITDKPVR
ncbi:MAG TPA: radical SAM protein [bacterium]|nr:radical SAM protein [bacterium]